MQPNTSDSTVRDRSRRLRAAVDRLERDRETSADGAGTEAPADGETASEHRSDEPGRVGTEPGAESTAKPSGVEPVADRCGACGTTIGPREYRISRIVEQGPDAPTLEVHYCSEACLTDDERDRPNPEATSESNPSSDRSEPRDWSYCR